jgi:hypothetical protein
MVTLVLPTAVTVPLSGKPKSPWCSCASGTPSAPLSPGCGSAELDAYVEEGEGVDMAACALKPPTSAPPATSPTATYPIFAALELMFMVSPYPSEDRAEMCPDTDTFESIPAARL